MEQTSYSKLSQRDVDRAETDLLINLSTLTQRGLAKMIGCHESKISNRTSPLGVVAPGRNLGQRRPICYTSGTIF